MLYELGRFQVNTAQRLLLSGKTPVALPQKALDLLVYFIEHRGELLDKATLMKALWPKAIVEENNLTQHISSLRRVLGDGRDGERYIVTIAGRGYQFVAPVTKVAATVTTAEPDVQTPKLDAPRTSVAVIPFVNMTGEVDKEYFSDGMAEELIHLLSRVPGLKVPARTSSFAYKGRNIHVREIARDLEVATILEGSVRSAGERIRVTAQLVDAATGYHLWSQSFDRKFEDLFKLQDELAGAIVQAINIKMNAALPVAVDQPAPTRDLEAYRLHLQGRSLIMLPSEQNLFRAIELLDQAITLDPDFASAFAARALANHEFVSLGYSRPESLGQAERDARQALALNANLAEAHVVLGLVQAQRGRWRNAEADFRAALSIDDSDANLRGDRMLFMTAASGYLRQALQHAKDAYRLAPANNRVLVRLSLLTSIVGSHEEALRLAKLASGLGFPESLVPLPIICAHAALHAGRHAEAAKSMIKALSDPMLASGGAKVVKLVFSALQNADQKVSAIKALRQLDAAVGVAHMSTHTTLMLAIEWYTLLGALDEAHELANRWVQRFVESGLVGLLPLAAIWRPELRAFRQDPRFQSFVTRLGLIEYWQVYGPPDNSELRGNQLICH